MLLRPTLRKATELGFALTAVATMILAGCGGGGSSTTTGGSSSTPAATTSASITPFKGPFYSGATVTLKDANGNPVALTSGGTINANGVASVTYNANVTYPLIVEVTGSYYNEITKATESTTVPIRSLIQNATEAAAGVPVTIVTETAVADLETRLGSFAASHPIQAASAVAALSAAGTMLGVPASAVPAFNPTTNQTSDANTLRLAAWAIAANGQTGATLAEKVKALANGLVNPANTPSTLISQAAYNQALTSVTSGASSVLAAGASVPAPHTIPTTNYASLYASAGGNNSGGGTGGNGSGGTPPLGTLFATNAPSYVGDFTPDVPVAVSTSGAGVALTTVTWIEIHNPNVVVESLSVGFHSAGSIFAAGTPSYLQYLVSNASTGAALPATLINCAQTPATCAGMSLDANTHTVTFTNVAVDGVTLNGTLSYSPSPSASIPATPLSVTATAASASQVNLSWAAVSGATGYNVYRSTTTGVTVGAGTKITASPVATTTYNNTGLTASTPYYYKVTAVNAVGESLGSAEVTATTNAPAIVTPAAPGGVTAIAVSASQVNLNWPAVSGATGYNVYRSTTTGVTVGAGSKITASPVTSTSYNNTGLAASTPYYYTVTAVNSAGESFGSAEVTATTIVTAPTGIAVTGVSPTQVSLSWQAVAAATGYNVYRATSAGVVVGAANLITASPLVTTSYNDTAVAASVTYYYSITAVNALGESIGSVEVGANTGQMGGAIQGTVLNLTTSVTTPFVYPSAGFSAAAPHGITTDGTNLYVTERANNTIRKISIASGTVTTLAGGTNGTSADGVGAMASFDQPTGITTDGTNLYVTDYMNHTIRKIVIATGAVSTFAGTAGTQGAVNATGAAASFQWPEGITTDGTNLYVAEGAFNYRIRKIVIATREVTTIAGSGSSGLTNDTGTAASFQRPDGITTDGTNLYVADKHAIRQIVIATGAVSTLAGSGNPGGVDATGSNASFNFTRHLTTDGTNLYVVDGVNYTIRKIVIATGEVITLAGSGVPGLTNATGTAASFSQPYGITTDGTHLYVSDTGSSNIRRIQ